MNVEKNRKDQKRTVVLAFRLLRRSCKACEMKFESEGKDLTVLNNKLYLIAELNKDKSDSLTEVLSRAQTSLPDRESRDKLKDHLDDMEKLLRGYSEELSLMAEEFDFNKAMLNMIEVSVKKLSVDD
jgi:hypothetical protein